MVTIVIIIKRRDTIIGIWATRGAQEWLRIKYNEKNDGTVAPFELKEIVRELT